MPFDEPDTIGCYATIRYDRARQPARDNRDCTLHRFVGTHELSCALSLHCKPFDKRSIQIGTDTKREYSAVSSQSIHSCCDRLGISLSDRGLSICDKENK